MINKLASEVYENARNKGFYDQEKNIGEMLCLIHSEVSEALEADREGRYFKTSPNIKTWWILAMADPDFIDTFFADKDFKEAFDAHVKNTFEDELADIVIRVMDLAAFKRVDLESHIKAKIRYNSLRERMHGKKY